MEEQKTKFFSGFFWALGPIDNLGSMARREDLPADLIDGLDITAVTPVSGGDIASAYRLDTADGPVFCKVRFDGVGMFQREASGLTKLRDHAPAEISVPEVLAVSDQGLVLEWIDESRRRTASSEDEFGRGLAAIHQVTNDAFGVVDDFSTIRHGTIPIDLEPYDDWPEHYVNHRCRPLATEAIRRGALDSRALELLDRCDAKRDDLCGPVEPPALLHGDLWAGNRVIDAVGHNWLIDPSCQWGHREYDLAMMQLFGGFGDRCFTAYDEVFPLDAAWGERIEWYQLGPMLAHAVMFGSGYGTGAMAILRRYA